jgi:hypothetical protein
MDQGKGSSLGVASAAASLLSPHKDARISVHCGPEDQYAIVSWFLSFSDFTIRTHIYMIQLKAR